MEVGETLDVSTAAAWRAWLERNHTVKREIWLVLHAKASGRDSIAYNDAVDEALCFGWIDSTAKKVDADRTAQRFTPRRAGSKTSEMNKARARRLVRERRMTPVGLAAIGTLRAPRLVLPADIRAALERDETAWRHFQRFPVAYRRIRVAFVEGARRRPAEFQRRLRNLVRRSAKNERFGMVRE